MSGVGARHKRANGTVRLGVLGCGWIANLVHLPELVRVRGLRVTALADPEAGQLERARIHVPSAECFTDYQALLERADVDAVMVCLPDSLHADACERAFAAGKHVYLEKPLAETLVDGVRAVAAWRASRRIGMIGFNYRFNPAYRAAAAAIREGLIGRPLGVRSAFTVPARERPVWQRERAVAGVLLNLASHHFDLVPFVLGTNVASVAGVSNGDTGNLATTVQLTLDDGVPVQSFFAERGVHQDSMEIFGEDGKLTVDRLAARNVSIQSAHDGSESSRAKLLREMLPPSSGWRRLRAPGREDSFRSAFEAFAAAVRSGDDGLSPDLADGFRSLAVVTAAVEAVATGGHVAPTSELSQPA